MAAVLHRLLNYAGSPHDFTFRAFVDGLKPHLRGDEHWRPQVDFLVYKTYDDVFRLEDFPKAVRTLRKKIGLQVRDARDLTRHGTEQFKVIAGKECVADIGAFDLLATKRAGKAPALRNFYDAPLIETVARLYADNLEFYRREAGGKLTF